MKESAEWGTLSISQPFVDKDYPVVREPRSLPERQRRVAYPGRRRAILAFSGPYAGIILSQADIVRHNLVHNIVQAYDRKKQEQSESRK